ncbi:Glycosyl transferase, family 2 [Kalmanozyma brasiliensis GHG001]|uniref:dolichyl-phosphate beta-glucosyltransferase n=1 Tax=Kalmanozyma brasiliensis (strain GHG001) TaxID=1365824 RepID=V5EVE9_KALBG|nr:Glycosyl transferase, family 2 [Kalmanozyma brasiliensis GHG001]EST06174.1 Glycosyl transferase, family 2 [Kalmanozyma brasiliensis GHG001]
MGAACCAGGAIAGSAGSSSLLDGTIYSFLTAIPIALYHHYPQVAIALITLLAVAASSLYILLIFLTPDTKTSSSSELTFLSTKSKQPQSLPSLLDDVEEELGGGVNEAVQLSVVVPAYNEKERLPVMLKETVEYLDGLKEGRRSLVQGLPLKKNTASNGSSNGSTSRTPVHSALHDPLTSYEIIIVDDGSKDDTHQVALDFAQSSPSAASTIRVVRLVKNRGKGGAVRHGVLHSRGHLILFADADGATSFPDLSKLCSTLSRVITPKGHGVAVGSRAHMVKSDAVVKRSFLRNFLMHGFHLFLTLLLRPPTLSGLVRQVFGRKKQKQCKGVVALPTQPEIKDTQCGFKLFTRPTAKLVFPASHIDGWIFDVELLILAQTASQLALQQQPPSTPQLGGNEAESEELARLPVPIAEVSVDWQEVTGSKIDLVKDSVRMALDLIVIRANYGLGRWKGPKAAL